MTRLRLPAPHSSRPAARATCLAVAAVTVSALVTACGAGNNAPTSQRYNVADGLQASEGAIRVLNALVVAGKTGDGTLSLTIVNSDPTQQIALQGIEVGKAAAVLAGSDGNIGPRQTLSIGPTMKVQGGVPAGTVTAGSYVPLVLHFTGATATVTMNAAVVPADSYYASLSPAPAATPTAAEVDPSAIVESGTPIEPSDAPSS